MNGLGRLRQRLTTGARIEVVDNTFIPERRGECYRIRDAYGDVAGIAGIRGCDRHGQISVPMDDDLVTWVDSDTVRWPIPRRVDGRGRPHTVTYRFLAAQAHGRTAKPGRAS